MIGIIFVLFIFVKWGGGVEKVDWKAGITEIKHSKL